ncbi:hypothetical protein PENTCL1PPCAC_8046, partial [Pristionchus entomophagus]
SVDGNIVDRFNRLRIRFERCDKKQLEQQTSAIFAKLEVKKCALCAVNIVSATNLVEHICSDKHVLVMQGVVCSDSYWFWWNAMKPVYGARPEPISSSKLDSPKGNVLGAVPPSNLVELSVLTRTHIVDNLCVNLKRDLAKMLIIFNFCDTKKLESDPSTRKLFVKVARLLLISL